MISCHEPSRRRVLLGDMNDEPMNDEARSRDARLVRQAAAGDQRAFEELVASHQGLACAVAYAACGDFHRSEELAQEAFISAWRHLGQLKDPSAFRSWLCGIVRNQAAGDLRRRHGQDRLRNRLEAADETDPAPSPAEQAADGDEVAFVLRQLHLLPDIYREPMVLFYRSGESVAFVALQLEISEDLVRQRLARGRAMLTGRMEQALGGALRASAPKPGFASGVVGLIGAGSAPLAVGSGASAKASVGVGFWAMVAGTFAGLWMLYAAAKDAALSDADWRAMRRAIWWYLGLVLLIGPALIYWITVRAGASRPAIFLFGLGLMACLQLFMIWGLRLRERKLRAEGLTEAVAAKVWRFDYGQKGFWLGVAGYLLIFGFCTNYSFHFVRQQLTGSFQALVFGTPALFAVVAGILVRLRPERFRRILMGFLVLICAQYLGYLGFMWARWEADGTIVLRSVLTAIQTFHAAILIGAALISYFWWRWEGWDHPATGSAD
jgi:RNA polymerase sigma factor (sigma-70 family)